MCGQFLEINVGPVLLLYLCGAGVLPLECCPTAFQICTRTQTYRVVARKLYNDVLIQGYKDFTLYVSCRHFERGAKYRIKNVVCAKIKRPCVTVYNIASPQQGDLMFLGPLSGQGAGGRARTRDRWVPADHRTDLLSSVPPMARS
ncbi:hypothetical protein PoB_001547400 [Plakobranchus ocellatus]|uniref:NTR domain-containing protein n=1 Tax=Plakobranchus ocellatus TaxID=259542 RepID=A0AAV3Z3J6_9GAST|nr:hypothetical protein PoB_001547400 [Plakobranchus ocellatus]